MAEVRASVYLLVLLLTFQKCSPAFGNGLWCSLFDCDDDDDDDYDDSDIFSLLMDPCNFCESKPAASPAASESVAEPPSEEGTSTNPQQIHLGITAASGVNLTLENSGTGWWVNLLPWSGGGSAATPAPPAATTTPAGNGTAANETAA